MQYLFRLTGTWGTRRYRGEGVLLAIFASSPITNSRAGGDAKREKNGAEEHAKSAAELIFQPGDKVKFSPKMREDLTGVRSENALNWMETWTGTVESVNDAKPKKAVQVYWKTGGESEGWTSVPKEHLIKLSGSQTGFWSETQSAQKTAQKNTQKARRRLDNCIGWQG